MAELVAVIIIASILAVFATSSFDRLTFDTAKFADQVRAQLSYARKVAIGAHRPVQVTVAGNTVTLTACNAFTACGSPSALPSPSGSGPFTVTAPDNVTIGPDQSFTFDAEGGVGSAVTLTITGDGSRIVIVHAGTGYVDVQ